MVLSGDTAPKFSVMLPMLVEEPGSADSKDEVGSGDATLVVEERASQSLVDEGCAEEGAQEQKQLARGLDTRASGPQPSSSVRPEQLEQVS